MEIDTRNVRCVGISVHSFDKRLHISALGFRSAKALLRVPSIPLVSLPVQFFGCEERPSGGLFHDTIDIPLHRLLVEAIEAEAIGWRRP